MKFFIIGTEKMISRDLVDHQFVLVNFGYWKGLFEQKSELREFFVKDNFIDIDLSFNHSN